MGAGYTAFVSSASDRSSHADIVALTEIRFRRGNFTATAEASPTEPGNLQFRPEFRIGPVRAVLIHLSRLLLLPAGTRRHLEDGSPVGVVCVVRQCSQRLIALLYSGP